jgi:hypothetical protein
MKKSLLLILTLFSFSFVEAHVNLNSPQGGETYIPGDTVIIEWQIEISHNVNNWDLSVSYDGGLNYEELEFNIPSTGTNVGLVVTYEWIVPNNPGNQVRIRVVMDNMGTDYNDNSENFSISATLGIENIKNEIELSVYPNPFSAYTTFEINNDKNEKLVLILYDVQGKLNRTMNNSKGDKIILHRDNLTSGVYFYQLISNGEIRSQGKLVVD